MVLALHLKLMHTIKLGNQEHENSVETGKVYRLDVPQRVEIKEGQTCANFMAAISHDKLVKNLLRVI